MASIILSIQSEMTNKAQVPMEHILRVQNKQKEEKIYNKLLKCERKKNKQDFMIESKAGRPTS